MPKRKEPPNPQEQAERFRREAQRLIDAGELSPVEAEKRLEWYLGGIQAERGNPK
jgi:hypothetical protein